jgi:TM2 domain-containing membrane protein YozV
MTPSNVLNEYQNRLRDRKTTSYIFWLLCFVGFAGAHRVYNGKVLSGLLWFVTWGIFGFGQFVDLLLIPDMSEQRDRKLYGDPLASLAATSALVSPKESLPVQLLKLAQKNGGKLTVTQCVMATGESFQTIEQHLKEMVNAGYADVTNHPGSGVIVYEFHELMVR